MIKIYQTCLELLTIWYYFQERYKIPINRWEIKVFRERKNLTAIKKPRKRYSARGTCCTRACSLFTRAFHRNSQHARAHAHTEASCVRACASTNAFALAASYLHHKASPLSWPTYPTPRRLITPGSVQIKRVTPRRNPDARPSATLFHPPNSTVLWFSLLSILNERSEKWKYLKVFTPKQWSMLGRKFICLALLYAFTVPTCVKS